MITDPEKLGGLYQGSDRMRRVKFNGQLRRAPQRDAET